MARYSVFPIRLGQKAAEPIGLEFRDLYRLVANSFVVAPEHDDDRSVTTLPLWDESEISVQRPALTSILAEDKPELVIIDLANSNRKILPRYSAIKPIVEVCLETETNPRLVILLSTPLWDEDPPMMFLRPLIDRGQCSLLFDNGSVLGAPPASPLSVESYSHAARRARHTPLWLLQNKIVRNHGHFKRKRNGAHSHCIHYFFDGARCTVELAELLAEKVRGIPREEHASTIICNLSDSEWLHGAARAAANHLNYELHFVDPNQPVPNDQYELPRSPVVVLSVCDTGSTMSQIIQFLKSLNADSDPKVLAVISTEGEKPENSRRIVRIGDEQYDVEYLLRVARQKFAPGECDLCKVGIPPFDGLTGQSGAIPTFAMWNMIFEAGLRVEVDVPDRQSLGLVPNFLAIVENNGPYLATKIHKTLTSLKGGLPRDPIIICPDESGARKLADALVHLFKFTVIRIPRAIIKLPESANDAEHQNSEWFVQLNSLRARGDATELIVLDEFNALGGTRKGLKAIANRFDLGVRCYLSLCDFNPGLSSSSEAQVHSLYAIDWLGSNAPILVPEMTDA